MPSKIKKTPVEVVPEYLLITVTKRRLRSSTLALTSHFSDGSVLPIGLFPVRKGSTVRVDLIPTAEPPKA